MCDVTTSSRASGEPSPWSSTGGVGSCSVNFVSCGDDGGGADCAAVIVPARSAGVRRRSAADSLPVRRVVISVPPDLVPIAESVDGGSAGEEPLVLAVDKPGTPPRSGTGPDVLVGDAYGDRRT